MTDDPTEIRSAGLTSNAAGAVSLRDALQPVARHWRRLALAAVSAVVVVIAVIVVRGERYEARMIVATVSSQPGINLGGAAALLASAGGAAPTQAGLQVSPLLIADLMQSRRVLLAVGHSAAPGRQDRVVDLVANKRVREEKIVEEMDDVITVRVAKETGLVSLGVILADSALAREVARRIIAEVTRTYVETARAQATQLRHAQDARVDSARRTLARLAREQQLFQQANRTIPSYSELATQQQSLQREVGVAEQVYAKAVSDREAAIAKELEETPVVVTVDPLPAILPRVSRHIVLFTGLSMIATLTLGLLWIFVADALRAPPTAGQPGESARDVSPMSARSRSRVGA